MNVLVTGGAGYIGSVIAARLLAAGHAVTVYDDLSRGHRAAVPAGATLVTGDIRDAGGVAAALASGGCEAIVHMAALAEVAESVAFPERYHDVNVGGTQAVLDAALRSGVSRLVFSSTAAVYGAPASIPIDEDAPLAPANPYGETKLAAERLLAEAAAASGGRLATVALRYFNAAGADEDAEIGERHDPETHLIPNLVRATLGSAPGLKVFGNDYPTPDGSCVRDYIHVADLAEAHVAALRWLAQGGESRAFNLGTGEGLTVFQMIDAAERVIGRKPPYEVVGRRAGDPARLVADASAAQAAFNWKPSRSVADSLIRTVVRFEQRND
jgi:UDP-glucose 4-epimerase